MNKRESISCAFNDRFGVIPIIVKAPGRVNIIGEHTDYNDGFVLPAAINRFAYVAIHKNSTNTCNIFARDLDESFSFSLKESLKPIVGGWKNIILGVTQEFLNHKVPVTGFDLLLTSNVPIGSGMSSSAAIESAFGLALNELFKAGLAMEEIGLIGQRAEHEFVGVKCGIMDQFASIFGKANRVVKLDCRTLEREYFPADFGGYQMVLIDSKVKHELVESEYNIRREQCEIGVAEMRKNNPSLKALRDAKLADLESIRSVVDKKVFDRCKYVIQENERVLKACEALLSNDILELGNLMYETHDGLSNLYEVSCSELDFLVEYTKDEEAVIGSRMMGGGFGGCTINLIEKERVDEVCDKVLMAYKDLLGQNAEVYKLNIAEGAKVI